jgi:TPR repeat protein
MRRLKHQADQGDPRSQCDFGLDLLLHSPNRSDIALAPKYFQMAADQHFPEGQFQLGYCLEFGKGVRIDLERAVRYYKRAGDAQHLGALTNYGRCLLTGKGVGTDSEAAARCFKLAADQGFAAAQDNYGLCLRHGIGVAMDLEKAVSYFARAADQNLSSAQHNLGLMFWLGIGVPRNAAKSASLFSRAAEQGLADAQMRFGLCLFYGQGVPADRPGARKWFEAAARQGDVAAMTFLTMPQRREPVIAPSEPSPLVPLVSMRDYDLVTRFPLGWVGRGSADVYVHSKTRRPVVIREYAPNSPEPSRELDARFRVNHHPCIVSVLGYVPEQDGEGAKLVVEYMQKGSLKMELENVRSGRPSILNDPTVRVITIVGIALAMRFAHGQKVMHRNLTPSNILFDNGARVHVNDFGRAKYGDTASDGGIGDFLYMAPEIYESVSYSNKVDVFSFGLLTYEILEQAAAFSRPSGAASVTQRALTGKRAPFNKIQARLARDIIESCWSVGPDSGPTFADVIGRLHAGDFALVPDGDVARVREYVKEVEQWEAHHPPLP